MKRRNKSDIPAQAFLLAAATILAVLLVSILISQYNQSKDLTNIVTKNMVDATNEIKNSNIEQYDGLIVSGSDVVNFFKRYIYSGEETFTLYVYYEDGSPKEFKYTGDNKVALKSDLKEITDATKSAYINPIDSFRGSIKYNANKVITDVTFTFESQP